METGGQPSFQPPLHRALCNTFACQHDMFQALQLSPIKDPFGADVLRGFRDLGFQLEYRLIQIPISRSGDGRVNLFLHNACKRLSPGKKPRAPWAGALVKKPRRNTVFLESLEVFKRRVDVALRDMV